MNIKKVCIVGSGMMGSGIAQVSAQAGLSVSLCDISLQMLEKARNSIKSSLTKFAEKGKIKEDVNTVMSRIKTSTDYEIADADLVIEAVFEDIKLKHEVLKKISSLASAKTIIASNTSAIPISRLAVATSCPEQFLGLHFFSPVPMMMTVEVIRGLSTTEKVLQFGADFVRLVGKEPLLVHRDIAGFVLNRINMLTNIEAARLVEQGVATPEDIDKGVRLAFGRKMGPFETTDMVGLDVQLMAYTNVYEEEKEMRFYPPSILRQKVYAGHLGRKTGKGWYEYNPDGTRKK
ncbi:MAG: putative 3-hydroxybutyryl-CoA dehydrogenase [Smithella sp. PtaU1.Bin162]|nr:MAG: putative 3-hydroxybutyryl-CoA dehydrogenase [Smithella sp. PtaU1.Bin162]